MELRAGQVLVKENVLPRFNLVRAEHELANWPKDWFGLLFGEELVCVFKGPLLRDPSKDLSEDDVDWMPALPDEVEQYQEAAEALKDALALKGEPGLALTRAAVAAGFNVQAHGELEYWLLDHMAAQVE